MPDQEPITREFLVDVLTKMEERFEKKLDAGFADFEAKFDKKLDTRFAEFETKFDKKLDARFAEFETKFNEKLEDVETKLLGSFYGWARSMEVRVRDYTNHVAGTDERLVLLEERISRLEMRKG